MTSIHSISRKLPSTFAKTACGEVYLTPKGWILLCHSFLTGCYLVTVVPCEQHRYRRYVPLNDLERGPWDLSAGLPQVYKRLYQFDNFRGVCCLCYLCSSKTK
jgi:hypothetical protein